MLVLARADLRVASLGRGEVGALFLRTRSTLDDGTPVTVIDALDDALRDAFYLQVLGRSPVQMHAYWSRMVFSGGGRPPARLDLASALGRLRESATAHLAYIPAADAGRLDLRGLRVVYSSGDTR